MLPLEISIRTESIQNKLKQKLIDAINNNSYVIVEGEDTLSSGVQTMVVKIHYGYETTIVHGD